VITSRRKGQVDGMGSRNARLTSILLGGFLLLLAAGFVSAWTIAQEAVDRHDLKDGVKITDTYFVGKDVNKVHFFFEPLPDKTTGQIAKETRTAFVQTIQTVDGGAITGNGTFLERVIAFFKWPVAIISGIFLAIILWVVVEKWLKGIGKPKDTAPKPYAASAALLYVCIIIIFAGSVLIITSGRFEFQKVLFDNATDKNCMLRVEGLDIPIPSKTYVQINLRCGIEDLTLFQGAADKTGTRILLDVPSTKHLPIYNIDTANSYWYDSATYIGMGGLG
jgi:hypothetical protein